MKACRKGFSLIEILVALMFIAFAMLALLWSNQMSQRGAMDSQYELLANSLAQEPIEVYQYLGFRWIRQLMAGKVPPLKAYPIGIWSKLAQDPLAKVQHPVGAGQFMRRIDIDSTPMERQGVKGYRLRVTIAPTAGGAAAAWLSRDKITQEVLIVEGGG